MLIWFVALYLLATVAIGFYASTRVHNTPDLASGGPNMGFPNVAAMRSRDWKDKSGYTYGLHGTPTTFILEERLCALEGGLQCVLVPSGRAAIANVALALLKTGDEVLIPDNAYGPNKALAEGELAAFGITHQYYDPMDVADLAARITPKTKLVCPGR